MLGMGMCPANDTRKRRWPELSSGLRIGKPVLEGEPPGSPGYPSHLLRIASPDFVSEGKMCSSIEPISLGCNKAAAPVEFKSTPPGATVYVNGEKQADHTNISWPGSHVLSKQERQAKCRVDDAARLCQLPEASDFAARHICYGRMQTEEDAVIHSLLSIQDAACIAIHVIVKQFAALRCGLRYGSNCTNGVDRMSVADLFRSMSWCTTARTSSV